jgi:para-nitrobenzyl esterase
MRDATQFSASCYQSAPRSWGPFTDEFVQVGAISEDCLYLNVWTPTKRAARLPVLVWIHGGGFGSGSGSVPIYNGARLAARGAVVVSINYRVGAFGFLAHPALRRESARRVSGNYGLLDMIEALRWVRAHIVEFGGDPARVTIAGQSAGAIAVNDLLVSPLAKGLFAGAIAQSGSGMGVRALPLAEAEAYGEELYRTVGADTAQALRALPAERVLALADAGPPTKDGKPRPRGLSFAPVLDGFVLPQDPDRPDTRPQSQVPLLTGFNADEGYIFGVPAMTPESFESMVRDRYGAQADGFLGAYPHANAEEATASAALIARDRYMASLVLWCQGRSAVDRAAIYPYLYVHPYPGPEQAKFGSFHTSEVPYVFGVLDQGGRTFTQADHELSVVLMDRWLAFMKTGSPDVRGLPEWIPVGPAATQVMGLGDLPGMTPGVSTLERLELFRQYVAAGGQLSLF